MWTRILALATATFASVWLVAPTAQALTAPQAIAALNAQREANGIPGGIVEDPTWSVGCARHMNYIALNSNVLTHDESSGSPGYTADGAFAGGSSVLQSPDVAWADTNPWETAPIHLMQLLAPQLSVTGYAPGCMFTWPGYQRPVPAAPVLLSYPGDGRTAVPFAQNAHESPFVPGDFVGLPMGTTTGPHLFVFAWGLGRGRLASASLSGPSGPVDVRLVDNTTTGSLGSLGSFLPPGGIVIPAGPLAPRATYTASVVFEGPASSDPRGFGDASAPPVALARTWSFTTVGLPPNSSVGMVDGTLHMSSDSPAAAAVTVTRRATGVVVLTEQMQRGVRLRPALAPDAYEVCFVQPPQGTYEGAQHCEFSRYNVKLRVRLRRLAARGSTARVAVTLDPMVAGVRARVTIRTYSCARCYGHAAVREVGLHAGLVLSARVPSGGFVTFQVVARRASDRAAGILYTTGRAKLRVSSPARRRHGS